MLNIHGAVRRTCDGFSRREIIQAGGSGLFGLSLPNLLLAESQSLALQPKAKSVIFLLLFGGPSQLETFDMKPDAPEQIRGPFRPIASRTPELLISEHLPHTANVSDKFCVIRTMTHTLNDHSGGGHFIQTGKRWHVPIENPVSPEDLAATIYHALGIDHDLRILNSENRPSPIVEGGSPVSALF